MKKRFKLKALITAILTCCLFVGCVETMQQSTMQPRTGGGAKATSIDRMSFYERDALYAKEFTVVGIVIIRPERPVEMTTSTGKFEMVSPINLRLMEEARRIGAHDIIDVRIEKLADGSWVAATALAIKYERGFFEGERKR